MNAGKGHLVAAVAVGEVLAVLRPAGIVAEILGRWGCPLVQKCRAGSRRAIEARAPASSRCPLHEAVVVLQRLMASAGVAHTGVFTSTWFREVAHDVHVIGEVGRRERETAAVDAQRLFSPGRSRPPASERGLIHRGRAA